MATSQSSEPQSPRSGTPRPSIMKRHSSQGITRGVLKSPGAELDRGYIRPKQHARVVLPRNHSSGRNLAKLARQNEAVKHTRQRSHEGDTEIRLPGSLDESIRPAQMRRNLTSSNLPRNASHTKLKKNYSHGQLQRLGLEKKAPPSPALRGKNKRPKSLDWGLEKDLHEREVELLQQQEEQREGPKRVGFRVGEDDIPNMEGSGLDEGEWTEESASVSPYSTRVNTANNSRRASMQHERPSSLSHVEHVRSAQEHARSASIPGIVADKSAVAVDETQSDDTGSDETAAEETVDEVAAKEIVAEDISSQLAANITRDTASTKEPTQISTHDIVSETMSHPPPPQPVIQRSPLHAAKELPNPTAQLLRRNSNQLPAPAIVSSINAGSQHDSLNGSNAGSHAGSVQDELVSRFIPSTSNGSGTTTNLNTPKGSFHGEELHARQVKLGFGPVSPGSTISGSSGVNTPARSRIELRMLSEKALADQESAVERGPMVPAHVYDRRNESLKSYLQLVMNGFVATHIPLGPEIFQGRFKAVNTELKCVQKFKNPIAESVGRLSTLKGSKLNRKALAKTKSAANLPSRPKVSPKEEAKPVLTATKSSMVVKPRRTASRVVSFVGNDLSKEELTINDVAKEMWDSVLK